MKRHISLLLSTLVLFIAGFAIAQIRPNIGGYTRPPATVAPPNPQQLAPTLESCQQDNSRLRDRLRAEQEQTAQLRDQIAQFTSRGGSQVTAYCEGQFVSRNTWGASENCADSGYVCAPVSGLCRRDCNVSDDCSPDHRCDVEIHRCIRV
ncbi:MAG: hypothetical protein AAB680_03480 [Pseudomonadota bacterium]